MKKLYSVLLVLAMVLGMIPATAAAGPAKFDTAALAVGDKVLYAKYSAATVEDGALTEAAWQTNITLAGVKFGAVWDSETLYLGFAGTTAPAAPTAITVNGKSVTRAGVAGAAAREIRIPLSEAGINIDDFDPAVKLSVTAAGATWEGTLVFDSVEGGAVNQFPTTKTETDATVTYNKETETLHFVGEGAETVLVRHNGFAGDKAGIYNAAVGDMFKIIDSANPPVAFEFDVKVDYLPEFKRHYTSAAQKEICPGLYFSVTGKSYCDDGTVANTLTSGMTFGITYMGENLILSVRATDFKNGDIYAETTQLPLSFDLGKKLGEQFHLRLNYDAAKDTIDVFVDDTCVARIQNAEFDNPFRNAKTGYAAMLQVGAYSRNDFVVNGKNGFDITVSNMSIGAQKVMDPARLMDGLTFATIKGTNEFQTAIYSDLDLVSSIPGPLLIPLTWSSDRPDIIGTDGKISKVTKDETVTLTAALTNDPSQTKSFKLIVRGPDAVYASAAKETAAFAKTAVTVDGVPNESGWRLAGRVLNKADTLVAEYGFLWNQTHLFAAVDFVDGVGPVVLTFNGHTFTVENGKLLENGAEVAGAVVAVGTNAVELSLPLSAIGMGSKISTYGKTMPVHVTAGGFDGPANTLTLSDIAWFTSFTRNNNPKSSSASQTKVTNNPPVEGYQGFTKLESGWRMYDLYNPNGANPAGVRTYVMYQNAGFNDRTAGTRLEFEFRADKMPLGIWDDPDFDLRSYSNAGFTFVFGTAADATKYSWAVTCGIVNTEEGLVFVMRNDAAHKIALDKNVGDTFNLAVQWNLDDTLDVYVDGVKKGSFAAASMWKLGAAAQSVVFNVVRNERLPGSSGPEDSYDVTISNLAFGNTYNEDAGLLGKLSFADIANGNPSADKVSSNLTLPTTITDGLLDNVYNITWSSSDESVVTRTGVVTQPAVGIAFATLTATIDGRSKDFDLIIMGKSMDNSKVLHLVNDLDPAHGAGVAYNEMLFTFDTTNNSLIAVQDKSDRVNLVTLTDSDNKARLTAESLTLWVSDDNATYTQIRDFKLVHIGQKWYLYGFDARAKYVKVHYTQFRGAATSFTGAYGIMITAGYDASLVKAGTTEYTVTNNTTVQYDATLAVDGFTGDTARLRVFDKGGKLLYHYVDGGKLYVRYPELTVGSSAKVYVQQAAAGAIELASKENVYEITYGSREVYTDNSNTKNNRYILALPAGTKLANGTKLEQETVYAMGYKLMASTDGGRTWAIHSDVLNTAPMLKTPVERIGGSGAFTFDPHTGRMYFMCYWVSHPFEALDITLSHCEQMIIASDNGGKNWYLVDTLPRDIVNDPQSAYMLTYSGGTVLSTYDGKGPKVDIVFPMGSQYNNLGGFCTRVAYTKDGGESWQLSESLIIYPEPATNSENGTSEAYIQERDDGVLVLYTRCQYDSMDHFGVSYSLDSGVTWMEEVTTSKMYSTNTQATIRDYTVNGKTADLSIWGGNTALGGRSYTRNPLNVAVSANESETYRNIQNLFFESEMENYDYRNFTITNGTFEKVNETDMFITFGDLSGSRTFLRMFVQDFDKWFTRTRGGYDNFEHGTTQAEGWVVLEGGIDVSTANARDKYSMEIAKGSIVTRSVPYLQNGTVSMDLYVPAGAGFTVELQSAFSGEYADVAMPIGLRVENGKLYMNDSYKAIGSLNTGWNTLAFDLELLKDAATLSVNGGDPITLDVNAKAGDYVCYITIGTDSTVWVDEVLITSELEPVLASTAADKTAAEAVISQIKALENLSGEEQAAKAAEVLTAYNALTQVQQDLIDRNVLGNPNAPVAEAMVNYYEVLTGYLAPELPELTFADVKAGDWYYDAVAYATANGIMSGYNATTFGPNDTLNRAMVVQLLYNKEGQPALNGLTHAFSDVPADQWFNNAVTWGSANKVVSGFGGGVFKPNDNVTIEQVAVILRNYSGSPNGNGDLSKVGNHSSWAADALKWAVAEGILDNVPFTNATENATRAQAAQMLTNYLSK